MSSLSGLKIELRTLLVRGAERVLGRSLQEPTLTWGELRSSGRGSVGRHTYGRPTVYVYPGDTANVSLGSFASVAHDVEVFVGGNHRTDWVSTFPFRILFDLPGALEDGVPATRGDVVIGNDVWIGKGATILSGVHIGDGAVIGAYSVVSRDVRPYAVAVGNPAREVKRRFSDEVVEELLRMAWWDWPMEDIMEAIPLLCSPDVEGLIDRSRRSSSRLASG